MVSSPDCCDTMLAAGEDCARFKKSVVIILVSYKIERIVNYGDVSKPTFVTVKHFSQLSVTESPVASGQLAWRYRKGYNDDHGCRTKERKLSVKGGKVAR